MTRDPILTQNGRINGNRLGVVETKGGRVASVLTPVDPRTETWSIELSNVSKIRS